MKLLSGDDGRQTTDGSVSGRTVRLCLQTTFPAVGALLLAALIALPGVARAQLLPGSGEPTPDSVATRLGLPEGHSPNGALRRALVVPGWGQYYNRQYWKIPVVAAGLGGVIYALIYNWDQYFLYRNAYRYRRTRTGEFVPPPSEGEPDEYDGDFGGEKYRNAYRTVRAEVGLPPGNELPSSVRDQRQQFRRWGELSILGTGVYWILQVADAYVGAHLLGFEVEEVSMQVLPGRRGGLRGQLRVSL